MSGSQAASSLPAIRAAIGHIPQRLKTQNIPPNIHRGRLEILRRLLTRLVREERYELPLNRAIELRPYVERLFQLAIYRGPNDAYTNEMVNWWLIENDLRDKMFGVLVPRLKDYTEYTSIYQLPRERVEGYIRKQHVYWRQFDAAVLELKDNPFPPVVTEPEDYSNNLLNILLKNALKSLKSSTTTSEVAKS